MKNEPTIPETGQFVIVRNRPATVKNMKEKLITKSGDENTKYLHLIEIEYLDGWDFPAEDTVIWERERNSQIISSFELPDVVRKPPTNGDYFNSYVNAIRWSALGQYFDENGSSSNMRISSPWRSAIKLESYQLVPVYKALSMRRVRLLLADGVGLGKTIQAGLIITELITQRNAKRILIMCPASLQKQWQEEMRDKFNLDFKIMNSHEIFLLQKKFGIDVNPWNTVSKIITSMDFMRQEEISSRFEYASRERQKVGRKSWDILVVDEAHNFAPKGTDSKRTTMLREISKWFEHRLFLTATPHNGYTRTFTGLLEILDPLNFHRSSEFTPELRKSLSNSLIRRLKSDFINEDGSSYFPLRKVKSINVDLKKEELLLLDLLHEYKQKLLESKSSDRGVKIFIFTLLQKRLLSSILSFAKTWWVHLDTLYAKRRNATIATLNEAFKFINKANNYDQTDYEKENNEKYALKISTEASSIDLSELKEIQDKITKHLNSMGYFKEELEDSINIKKLVKDTKIYELLKWIQDHLLEGDSFKNDERVIIFTEYRDSLNLLLNVFYENKKWKDHIQNLHGSTSNNDRENIKAAFNDPRSSTRILISTDTAAEGLNLQMQCRYCIHFDIPWNPSRLEQRNGRVDRHGQSRDVTVFHFSSEQDDNMKFMGKIAEKINSIQDDLGKVGEVLDDVIYSRFYGEKELGTENEINYINSLDQSMNTKISTRNRKEKKQVILDANTQYSNSNKILNLHPKTLINLFTHAIKLENGVVKKLENGVSMEKIPEKWMKLFDNTVRKQGRSNRNPLLVFDHNELIVEEYGRKVFRQDPNKVFLTIGHPLMQRSISMMKKQLWGTFEYKEMTKWLITENSHSENLLIINILFTIRNGLSENLHSEILALKFEINFIEKQLLDSFRETNLKHQNIQGDIDLEKIRNNAKLVKPLRSLWIKIEKDLKKYLDGYSEEKMNSFNESLPKILSREISIEESSYNNRIKELKSRRSKREKTNLSKLRDKEKEALQKMHGNLEFFFDRDAFEHNLSLKKTKIEKIEKRIEELELASYINYIKSVENLINEEHREMMDEILPNRYVVKASEFHPVSLEFRLSRDKINELEGENQ